MALTCPQENSRPCKVTTNHFSVVLEVPQGVIYMYDVTVEPPWSRPYRRSVLLHSPSYRVFHDTGHPEIWLSSKPFINIIWTPGNFLSA